MFSVSLLMSWLLLLLLLPRLVGDPSPTLVALVVFVTLLLSFYPTGIFVDVFVINLEIRGSCCRPFFSVHKKEFTNVAAEGMSSISKTRHHVLGQNFSVVLVTMHSRKLHQVLTVSPRFAQK